MITLLSAPDALDCIQLQYDVSMDLRSLLP